MLFKSIMDFYSFGKIKFSSQYIIAETLSLEEDNIIQDIRNLFGLKMNKITLQSKV